MIIVLTVSHAATAQVGLKKTGQSTMNFLLVTVSPRAAAMGETYIAVGTGAESIFYNPAGITESSGRIDFSTSVTYWIADINYYANALVWNAKEWGTFGLSVMWVDYGTINGTSLIPMSDIALYPLGYREDGPVGNVGSYAIGLTYGRAISDRFMVGGSIRYAGQNLGTNHFYDGTVKDNNASKLVFDAGVKYYTGLKSFRFGMSIRNFSSNLKREEVSEQLPVLFSMGAALDLFDFILTSQAKSSDLLLAIDYLHPNNYTERANFGLEYMFMDFLALRGGYQTNRDLASWSCGFGLHSTIDKYLVSFDYSYSGFDYFDNVNRFSIGVAF